MTTAAISPMDMNGPLRWPKGPVRWRTDGEMDKSVASRNSTDKRQKGPSHELLGSRVFDGSEGEAQWESVIDIKQVPWLAEHVLLGQIVFPAAAYVTVAGESIRQLSNENLKSYTVKDLSITSALIWKHDQKVKLHTTLRSINVTSEIGQWYAVQIRSFDGNHWTEHCIGQISAHEPSVPQTINPSASEGEKLRRHVPQDYWYDVLENAGLEYGPVFQGLEDISSGLTENKAVATVPQSKDLTGYVLHPVTIEQCIQILMIAACRGQGKSLTGLPVTVAIERLVVSVGGHSKLKIQGITTKTSSNGVKGDVSATSEGDHLILSIQGCQISQISAQTTGKEEKLVSFVEWNSDATFVNLNRAFSSLHSSAEPLIDLLKLVAHKNPNLRILEIGNGADEMTRVILDSLKSRFNERLYSSYTYACTSLDVAFKLKSAFKTTDAITVEYYDVDKHLESSSLKVGTYDLVILTDLISSARPISKKYTDSLKALIHPHGYLVLPDALPGSHVSTYENALGVMNANLVESGFIFSDDDSSDGIKVFAQVKKIPKHSKRVTLVVPESPHALIDVVQKTLSENSIDCDKYAFEDKMPQDQDMIVLVDFVEPYLYNITEDRFRTFVKRLSTFKRSIIWVIPSVSLTCVNPDSSMILGLARTLRNEMRKDITVVEIEDQAVTFAGSSVALAKIYQNLAHRDKSGKIDPDYEYAIVDGDIKISRIHWTTKTQQVAEVTNHSFANGERTQMVQQSTADQTKFVQFQPDACYALVGGLGGLGRVIATWMVENGARSIMFVSRSAKEGPDTTPFFDELRALGCEVLACAADVTKPTDVEAALQKATKPMKGIMQMSAVMRDKPLSMMSYSEWQQSVRPRVQGTWNLHHATSSANLDFFLLLSSICGVTGQPAQSNYNSANTFLDAFVNYRQGQDLPASVVDIGLMGCTGIMVRENRELNKKLMASGYQFLGEQILLDSLGIAINYSKPEKDPLMNRSQLGIGLRSTKPMADPSTRVAWKRDARMAVSHHFQFLGPSTDEEAKQYLQSAF